MINKKTPYKFAILNVATKYNVTKSTIIDNCTRRLGINTYQFKELLSNRERLIQFLIIKFPSYKEKIMGHLYKTKLEIISKHSPK